MIILNFICFLRFSAGNRHRPAAVPESPQKAEETSYQMKSVQDGGVRFSIAPCGDAWTWETFDRQGRSLDHGLAKSKREAAAWIIRYTILSCLPTPEAIDRERVAA